MLGQADPKELWREIASHISDDILLKPDLKILVPGCGYATEALALANRMYKLGVPKDEIKYKFYLLDKYKSPTETLKLWGWPNVIRADFLTWQTPMNIDVIVMNAPYQKQTWLKFLDKAISLDPKFIAQIAPDGTGNFSSRSNKLEQTYIDNGIQVYEDCTSYFPNVQSGKICYAILDRASAADTSCFQKNDIETTILNKIISYNGNKVESKLSSKRSAASRKAPRFDNEQPNTVKALESVKKDSTIINYVDPKHTTIADGTKYYFANRFFGKDATSPIVEINETIGISPNIIAIEKVPGVSLEQFKNMMLTDVKRFALKVLRAGAFDTSPRHLRQISLVDDAAFNLTQDEIKYIEDNT
jgi:hypothetical protein